MIVNTSILWASLRFFTRVTCDRKAIKDDGSGSHGQLLFDDGEEPSRVQDDEQLAGQLAHGVNQIDAAAGSLRRSRGRFG